VAAAEQTESSFPCPGTGAVNGAGDQSSEGRGGVWKEVERERKLSERPNGMGKKSSGRRNGLRDKIEGGEFW
jgi:hypothetical protein